MTTTADTPRPSAPWHLWAVAVIGLLWNGYGAYDYTMSHLQGEAYYRASGMTDAQIAYMATYPSWMHGIWAIGVWGSAVGSVLLLLRMKWAMHAFGLSMVGAVVALLYGTVLSDGLAANGPAGAIFSAVICVICGLFLWYSWAMTKRGVLR